MTMLFTKVSPLVICHDVCEGFMESKLACNEVLRKQERKDHFGMCTDQFGQLSCYRDGSTVSSAQSEAMTCCYSVQR